MENTVAVITQPKQIHDLIAVRLFVFDHSNTTKRLAPGAYNWAIRRSIEVAVCEKTHLYFILPEEYNPYLDWSRIDFQSPALVDIFNVSLSMIHEVGWATVRKYVRRFSIDEKAWLLHKAPMHYGWLVR